MPELIDVAIVGGGPAGLAAAVTLGRSLRTVALVDAASPRNRFSTHAHNVLGNEGISPADLLAKGREEAASYGAALVDATVTRITGTRGDFTVFYDGGEVRARRIVLATGLTDVLPELDGLAEGWGTDVLHCPYCHGYEVRGQKIAVIATDPGAAHQAKLFGNLSDHVTVVPLDHRPDEEECAELTRLGVVVSGSTAARAVRENGALRGVELADGTLVKADAAVVAPLMRPNLELYESLGGRPETNSAGVKCVDTGEGGKTDIDGVWIAGNVSNIGAIVISSAASGVSAGAAINMDLIEEAARANG
ncbi:NAD(P)/FAD-dependent oxidoreductase [Corynebacterium qintianiae]|uniref:NAD(P)/FAD-dependent oxidoreductase n=1 Tax=Corynebacterium qintianiae TaxID=2709392 RepID=A0A7T0KN75_9CORY|nr:NAD(P)/FAD-dependent oxidoreductase [Corynebacterium qintianiae]QPK83765.1 NAD(P)/FAD-dependent oxidoreductase [Corynebacterium qintianiae]